MKFTLDQALQRGVEAHKAGKVQEADQYYTAILKANPKHPDANHNMGVLAVGVNKVEEALSFFKAALEINPKITQFWLSYINALIKLDRLADAKAVLDQAKSNGAKGDGFDQIEKRLGSVTYKNLDFQEAPNEELNALIKLYNQNRFQQVFNEAQKLTKQYTKSLDLWNLMGASAAQIGQLEKAALAFQKAIALRPDDADIHNNKGNVLKDQGKLEEAIASYNKAIVLKSDHADAYNNMGVVFQTQGKLDEAIEAYNKALLFRPDFAEALYNMGNTFRDQGKSEEAIEAYNKALSIKPDYAEAYNNKGFALKDQSKLEEAIEAYNKALTIKPDYASAKHMLSALTGNKTRTAPREHVENLFDEYSQKFEASLVNKLEYKVPKLITDILIKRNNKESLGSVLDLGCGSGLLGAEIRDHCFQLEGIDLSSKMLDLAKQKNVYDKLSHLDIVEYLSSNPLDFDYYIALDVFIYVGDLTEIFRLLKSRNKKPGHFVFSTEHTELNGYHILKSGRYSHSKSYVENLCRRFDYDISYFSTTNLRKEKGDFLTGGMYVLSF